MSGGGEGNGGTPESGGRQPDSAAPNAGSPNDAPGAPSATPGQVAPSGGAGRAAPPGTADRASTEEQRAQSSEAAEKAASEEAAGDEAAGEEAAGEETETLHGCPVADSIGAKVVHCNRDDYLALCRALKDDGYAMPIGLTGVDYLTHPGRVLPGGIRQERFEVVLELLDLVRRARLRVRCQVPVGDPWLPSVFDIWPGTEFHERETYDMFGIRFEGHPDLSRILMPEEWEGHPLRKDYDTGHVPVQFKEAPRGATI